MTINPYYGNGEFISTLKVFWKAWPYIRKDTNSWAKSWWNVKWYFHIREEIDSLLENK
jgi:hypothetical protein